MDQDIRESEPLKQEITESVTLKQKIAESETINQEASKLKKQSSFKVFLKNITVEPAAILFLSSAVLISVSNQTFFIDKTCRVNLKFGDEICDALRRKDGNTTEYEKELQEYIAPRLSLHSAVSSVIPCITLLFVGAWSDVIGKRRIIMLMPVIGEMCRCVNGVINLIFYYQIPVEYTIILDALSQSLFGGWNTWFIGVFSLISNLTSDSNRTHRMGFVSFCTYVGIPIGMGLSGVIVKKFGFYAVFFTSFVLLLVNVIYITFYLEDPPRTDEQKQHDGKGFLHSFKTFFDITNVKETFKVVFKKGPNKRRFRMCVLMGIVSILFGPMYGEISTMYLSTRYRFNWDELKFSIFQTYNFLTHTAGTMFSILVFSKYLQWHDAALGIISTLSKLAASFVYCFAPNEKIFFIAPLVEILNGTALLSTRAITSKLVAKDELGKLNSIFGLTENLMPLVYVPLYTKVYTLTMDTLPGFVFLMGAMMTVPAVIVFFWLFYEHRKNLTKIKTDEKLHNLN